MSQEGLPNDRERKRAARLQRIKELEAQIQALESEELNTPNQIFTKLPEKPVPIETAGSLRSRIIDQDLAYQDAILSEEVKQQTLDWSRNSESARRYADSIAQLSQRTNLEMLRQIARELVQRMGTEATRLGIPVSPYGGSNTWAMWDIGKQNYFFTHPAENNPAYEIGDPLTSKAKQAEIINRHLGWEAYAVFHGNVVPEWKQKIMSDSKFADALKLLNKPPKQNNTLSSKDLAELGKILREAKVETISEILDGKEAKDLFDSMREYTLESGDVLLAGTDKGIDYKFDKPNQDRVVVSTKDNFIAAIDGVGGASEGERAAEVLAESLLKNNRDIPSACSEAIEKMIAVEEEVAHIAKAEAGFASASIDIVNGKKFLKPSYWGDLGLVIMRRDGSIKFELEDDSYISWLKKETEKKGQKALISDDQALYSEHRNRVMTAVSPRHKDEKPKLLDPIEVEKGDIVILASDGIFDNITPEEIAAQIKAGLSGKELFQWISTMTGGRMRNAKKLIGIPEKEGGPSREQEVLEERKKTGVYKDGFRSKPKPDNRSLAILEIR